MTQFDGSFGFDQTDFTPQKQEETRVAAQVLNALMHAYPGYEWFVEVNFEGGICTVKPEFAGQWGYVLHLNAAASSSEFEKMAVWAGGELLERYNLSRVRADEAAIEALPTDARGFAIGDRSK